MTQQHNKNQIFITLGALRRSVSRTAGLICAWATQLWRNVAATDTDAMSDLTGLRIAPQTSRTDSDVLNNWANQPNDKLMRNNYVNGTTCYFE